MRGTRESGQAVIILLLAMALFLFGALGLAIDVSHMYAQRQMAQAAADAAAQAGVMTLFARTGDPAFGSTPYTCTATDATTPCIYARTNGFGTSASDTVAVDFPASVPGVTGSPDYEHAFVRVSVRRSVDTTLLRFVGPFSGDVRAVGVAAIVQVLAPVPILVTHPDLPGSFRLGGNPYIQICGGPARSIQVNSEDAAAMDVHGTATVDLSRAGPNDSGTCNTGTGADFGTFGGPFTNTTPSWLTPLGTTEHFVQPATPIEDPLRDVPAPTRPPDAPEPVPLADGLNGCPPSPAQPCKLYSPGTYTGIEVKNHTGVFMPGVYYIDGGGFGNAANGEMVMAKGFTDPVTADGMVVYNTGAGRFDVGANSSASLKGAPLDSVYKGILFFQDRSGPAHTGSKAHQLGGGGNLMLEGTIYLVNLGMTDTFYQELLLRGNSGNTTMIKGEIIVSTLDLGGGGTIVMQLNPDALLYINQVALVS